MPTYNGGSGNDTQSYGGSANDRMNGNAGDDTLNAGDGNDTIFGGTGNDSIYGGSGNDSIYGGGGNDHLSGEKGDDIISGGAGNDTLVGGTGHDALYGDDGNDTVDGGAGNDALSGGNGNDTISGGDGSDSIYGDAGDDLAYGGAGNDAVFGWTGNDQLYGGGGDDIMSGDQGDDTVHGDAGNDDVSGFSGSDTLYGGAGDDILYGGDGNDTVFGGDGNDTVSGDSGDDALDGRAGNDTLYGGAGNDTLTGGTGADTLDGGTGDDTLNIAGGDAATGGDGDDLFMLQDFAEAGAHDTFVFGGSGAEIGGDTLRLGSLARMSTLSATDDGTRSYSGSVEMDDGSMLYFQDIENIICFTFGTLIATAQGARAIDTLAIGDLVITRDHGLQPVRWIGARRVPARGCFAPVRLRAGTLTGQERDLLVSPQHRLLFQGYRAELLFGTSEVLVAARHLIDGRAVRRASGGTVTYVHMLFDAHEIVFAEGAATESFHPGEIGLSAVAPAAREELFALFPALRSAPDSYGGTARRCLRADEAALLATT